MDAKPWWFPQITDTKWCDNMRAEYPQKADWDDDSLRNHFSEGNKYHTLWDHLGDANEQFEKLADAYLEILKKHPEYEPKA